MDDGDRLRGSDHHPVLEDSDDISKTLLSNGSHAVMDKTVEENHNVTLKDDLDVKIDQGDRKPLIYRISQTPPWNLLLFFAFQQSLLAIGNSLSITIMVSEVVCAEKDDDLKTKLLSASLFMSGLSTFVMTTFGVRLPIFQGPASTYIVPLIAMSYLPEWTCPETFEGIDPITNSTILLAAVGNGTVVPARQVSEVMLAKMSGSLMLAGMLHFLIGVTGLVGILTRTFTVAVTLALFLSNRQTPIPMWTPKKGFHIIRYPLHQVFSILFSTVMGSIFCLILTTTGVLSNDPNSKEFLTPTDSRSHIIGQTDWFIFPYPGKLSSFSFSTGAFVCCIIATLGSVLDSIGDYNASARTARVSPPPAYAFNRGIAVEGLMSLLSGSMGCCHATVSYGGNIGAMGVTRVVSRSVFQMCGFIYIIFAVFGKIGATFITILYAVLGGTSVLIFGIFIGVILSYLQTIDLNSTRNLAILGTSLLLGLMMPYWCEKNPNALETGTLKERGLLDQMKEVDDEEAKELAKSYEDGPETYRFPWIPDSFRRSKIFKYIPIFEYTGNNKGMKE